MSGRSAMARTPPYSVHAERALMGALLARPELVEQVREIIPNGEAFFRSQYGQLYDVLRDDEDGSDLMERLAGRGTVLADLGGEVGLAELRRGAPIDAEAIAAARQIQDKALLRRLIDVVSDIIGDAYHAEDGFHAVLDRGRKSLSKLARQTKER